VHFVTHGLLLYAYVPLMPVLSEICSLVYTQTLDSVLGFYPPSPPGW